MIAVTSLSELTIDGKLSLRRGGSSRELFDCYGDQLRTWFHAQRAAHQAIMVGANTVRCDDPLLTVRYAAGSNPLRIVASSDAQLPLGAQLLNDGLPTLVAVSKRAEPAVLAALRAKPRVEVVCCGEQQVDLSQLLRVLAKRGISSLLVEGGSQLLHSLFADDLVGRIIVKHLPLLCGAADAPGFLQRTAGGSPMRLSRWSLEHWFVIDGVGISVHRAQAVPA